MDMENRTNGWNKGNLQKRGSSVVIKTKKRIKNE